jgi:hypothetical protein
MPEVFVKSFQVVDEQGRTFEAHEYQNMTEVRDMSGSSMMPGLKSYQLADGAHLNLVDGTFVNVRTGGKLVKK